MSFKNVMKDFFKNKVVTISIIVATLVLAGIAVFTAIRLFQLREQSVAPNVPSSRPRAQEASPSSVACSPLVFTLTSSSPSPTSTSTATGSGSASPTATATSTSKATATATAKAGGGTTSPTQAPIPESGISWPTITGIGIGLILIIGSLLIAL